MMDSEMRRRRQLVLTLVTVALAAGCGNGSDSTTPGEVVRARIDALAPAANLGHRGTGLTRAGHRFPENSIPSFEQAMSEGADGIELDVEITLDGGLVVMHDDTLDRTTTCSGCVSAWTLDDILAECRLLDGDGNPTTERPPTLPQAFAAAGRRALVNVELKVYGGECLTPTTGAPELTRLAIAQVDEIGASARTLFSSFDDQAIEVLETERPDLYGALLMDVVDSLSWEPSLARALELGADAIHPAFLIDAAGVGSALESGLQANLWTVNQPDDMTASIAKGATAIITDRPAVLRSVIDDEGS